MAVAPINKFITIAVPVSPNEQELYKAPVGTSAILLYAQVANVSAASTFPQITFTHRRRSVATRTAGNLRDNRLVRDIEIPPNDALVIVDGRLVLERTALVEDSIRITGIQTGITTITDVRYNGETGITTVTTLVPHGFNVDDQVTMAGIAFTCPSTAGITSAIFPNPQVAFVIDSIDGSVGTSKTFTTNSGIVKNLPHTYRGAFHRFVGLATETATPLGISTGTSGGPYSITAADYDPTDGDVELKIGSHALLGATLHTPTIIGGANGDYNRATGVLRLRIPSHNFSNTQKIKLKEESFTFSCGSGSSKYPRPANPDSGREADPAWNTWLSFAVVDSNNIDVQVGTTASGGNHTLTAVESGSVQRATDFVVLDPNSLKFKCSQDNYKTVHTYPRSTDPAITRGAIAVGQTTYAHTFVKATDAVTASGLVNQAWTPTDATYNSLTGDLQLTIGSGHALLAADTHQADTGTTYDPRVGIMTVQLAATPTQVIQTGQQVKINAGGVTFQCNAGGGVASQAYPRTTDPVYEQWRSITRINDSKFSIDVGVGTGGQYTHAFVSGVSGAINRATSRISIPANSLQFTCMRDWHKTVKTYPRSTDPVYQKQIAIGSTSTTTVTVNVGKTNIDTVTIPVGISSSGGRVGPLQMEFIGSILENSTT